MDIAGVIILALTVVLAAAAVWNIWRLRRGSTTVQRWQATLPWLVWIVLVVSLGLSLSVTREFGSYVLLASWGMLLLAAIALGLASWLQRRSARARDLQFGIPPEPHRPNWIGGWILALFGIPVVTMLSVLPWLALASASPPYPNLINATSMMAICVIGIALGVAIVTARWITYRAKIREREALVEGIERKIADAVSIAQSQEQQPGQ